MSKIVVRRRAGGYTDRVRKYGVHIDGSERGKVGHGESIATEVEPGTYEVKLKIDWAESPPVNVTVSEGEEAHLYCEPRTKPWSALYYSTFARKKWITLRPEG